MSFKELNLLNADLNPYKKIGEEWFLLTAGTKEKFNTMTASWGGMGVMWGKNIFTTVVRPTRHTYKYMEENDKFSISFFNESNKSDLKYCGSHSGRDVDKIAHTNLTPIFIDDIPTFEEAKTVFICNKIYRSEIVDEHFIDNSLFDFYKKDSFHIAFVGEILKAYEQE